MKTDHTYNNKSLRLASVQSRNTSNLMATPILRKEILGVIQQLTLPKGWGIVTFPSSVTIRPRLNTLPSVKLSFDKLSATIDVGRGWNVQSQVVKYDDVGQMYSDLQERMIEFGAVVEQVAVG